MRAVLSTCFPYSFYLYFLSDSFFEMFLRVTLPAAGAFLAAAGCFLVAAYADDAGPPLLKFFPILCIDDGFSAELD